MRVRPGTTGSTHVEEKITPLQIKAFANLEPQCVPTSEIYMEVNLNKIGFLVIILP